MSTDKTKKVKKVKKVKKAKKAKAPKYAPSIPNAIEIKPADGPGFIVTVGCKTLVYTDPAKLVKDLAAYLDDPKKTEAKLLGKSVRLTMRLQSFSHMDYAAKN